MCSEVDLTGKKMLATYDIGTVLLFDWEQQNELPALIIYAGQIYSRV